MSDPLFPMIPSGDNVFKYLFTMCIGLIAFNLLYPREKSLEIKQLISEYEYQSDLLEVKIEPIRVAHDELFKLKSNLDSIQSREGLYPLKLRNVYDSLYRKFDSGLNELNILNADLDHKQRMIKNLEDQLIYYESIALWTFWPSILIGIISLFFWIYLSVQKKENIN